jgi:hypothetical protein
MLVQEPDAVLYDEGRGLAYIPSALTGTLAVVALAGKQNNTLIDTVPTQIGARTGAVDPKTGKIYLPTAQYLSPTPAGKRPTPRPGTSPRRSARFTPMRSACSKRVAS